MGQTYQGGHQNASGRRSSKGLCLFSSPHELQLAPHYGRPRSESGESIHSTNEPYYGKVGFFHIVEEIFEVPNDTLHFYSAFTGRRYLITYYDVPPCHPRVLLPLEAKNLSIFLRERGAFGTQDSSCLNLDDF